MTHFSNNLRLGVRLIFPYRTDFFRSGWNLFDLAIVVIAWVPASGPFAVLRALRVLRVLRLLSVVPQMRRVISAIGHSIPGMLSVVGVLTLVLHKISSSEAYRAVYKALHGIFTGLSLVILSEIQ